MIATKTPGVEDFLGPSRDERCEFVLGEGIEKPLPNGPHSDVQIILGASLLDYGKRTGSGKPRPEWHHRFGPPDDLRIYIPDIVFLLAPRHLNAPDYADRASDVMIEIVSPNDRAPELLDKVEFYLQNGVSSVWIVDPSQKRVDIYKPGRRQRRIDGDGVLTDEILPGFGLPLAELFA